MIPPPSEHDLKRDPESDIRNAISAIEVSWICRCLAAEKERDEILAEFQLARRYINSKDVPLAYAIQMIDEQREATEARVKRLEGLAQRMSDELYRIAPEAECHPLIEEWYELTQEKR